MYLMIKSAMDENTADKHNSGSIMKVGLLFKCRQSLIKFH